MRRVSYFLILGAFLLFCGEKEERSHYYPFISPLDRKHTDFVDTATLQIVRYGYFFPLEEISLYRNRYLNLDFFSDKKELFSRKKTLLKIKDFLEPSPEKKLYPIWEKFYRFFLESSCLHAYYTALRDFLEVQKKPFPSYSSYNSSLIQDKEKIETFMKKEGYKVEKIDEFLPLEHPFVCKVVVYISKRDLIHPFLENPSLLESLQKGSLSF